MPRKNATRIFDTVGSFHVFNRGVEKRPIFADDHDRQAFMDVVIKAVQASGGLVRLTAYCLMPNHFHLLLDQRQAGAISNMMVGAMSSYVRKFNNRHDRVGPLFQERYRDVPVRSLQQLKNVIAYIHLNPRHYDEYEFSSHGLFLGRQQADWFDPRATEQIFGSIARYQQFVHQSKKRERELKNELTALWTPL